MRYATFRLVLVGLMVMGAACGSSPTTFAPPTSPSPAATPAFQHLDGVWRGFLKLTASTEYDVGTTLPFTLRISGGPQSYAGQFELQGGRVNVGISGTLREDGFAVL